MTSVLFVITIPTKDEEKCLKSANTQKLECKPKLYRKNGTDVTNIVTNSIFNQNLETSPLQKFESGKQETNQPVNEGIGASPRYEVIINQFRSSSNSVTTDSNTESSEGNSLPKSVENTSDNSSTNKRKEKKKSPGFDLDIPYDICMEVVMREIIKKFHIQNAVWTKDATDRMFQIVFTMNFDEMYEKILEKLNIWGIGEREGSTVSVMTCIASNTFTREIKNNNDEYDNAQKQSAWNRFMNSVHSRLNVAQIIQKVRQEAAVTFDFIILLIAAAFLAGLGITENSILLLVSSMLISPLMGPVIGGIFGFVIKDDALRTLGLKNEILGIIIGIIVGVVYGLIIYCIDPTYRNADSIVMEMHKRCDLHALLIGILVAVPSGAAVAISILGGNIGSLVGVAISASLLPPAVNAGILWSLACLYQGFGDSKSLKGSTSIYSTNQVIEFVIMGTISMFITISNIICVYVMGILVLKIKEIAPIISETNREFWKHDIKIARDLNKPGYDEEFANEFANLTKENQNEINAMGLDDDIMRTLHNVNYQHTWSPVNRENSSMQHVQRLYLTIARPSPNIRDHRFHCHTNCFQMLSTNENENNAYKLLKTTSSTATRPAINIFSNNVPPTSSTTTPTSTVDEGRARRTFIVTPAEDPLLYNSDNHETDV